MTPVRLASIITLPTGFIPVEVAGVWKGWSEENLISHKNPWKYLKMTPLREVYQKY